jgi:proline iminopeptidase
MYTPKPFNEGFLPAETGHQIYFAQYGNPEGEVIVNLHGGPGSRSKPKHVDICDLEKYQVVLFDQRGCGKSLPVGSIENVSTQASLSDMERLREYLKVEDWYVTGSSWGSTLALVYAEHFPERVKGLLLSAVWLGNKESVDWSLGENNGVKNMFPDVWAERNRLLKEIGVDENASATELLEKILSGTEAERLGVVQAFDVWDSNTLSLGTSVEYVSTEEIDETTINSVRIFLHYQANDFFLSEDEIMSNIGIIKDIPTIIVHGRFDVLCPFVGAWRLNQALAKSQLVALSSTAHRFSGEGQLARKYIFRGFLESLR